MGAGLPPVRFDADAVLPDKVPYASPAVRLFARELGVDLMQVTGSERGGAARVFQFLPPVGGGAASGADDERAGGDHRTDADEPEWDHYGRGRPV